MNLKLLNSEFGSPSWAREPNPPETLTRRPVADRFNSRNTAWVTAKVPKKLVSKVRLTASMLAALGAPSPALVMPTLLIKMSIAPRPSRGSRPR
jgi:hypothetical protein